MWKTPEHYLQLLSLVPLAFVLSVPGARATASTRADAGTDAVIQSAAPQHSRRVNGISSFLLNVDEPALLFVFGAGILTVSTAVHLTLRKGVTNQSREME